MFSAGIQGFKSPDQSLLDLSYTISSLHFTAFAVGKLAVCRQMQRFSTFRIVSLSILLAAVFVIIQFTARLEACRPPAA